MSSPTHTVETDTLISLELIVKEVVRETVREAVKEALKEAVKEVLDANQKVIRDSFSAKIYYYHINITPPNSLCS
jgi:hypothetical protein